MKNLFLNIIASALLPIFCVSCATPFGIFVSTEAQKVQTWSNSPAGQAIIATGVSAIGVLSPAFAPLAGLAARELQTGTVPTVAQAATVVQSLTGSGTEVNTIASALVAASMNSSQTVSSPNAGLEAVALAIDAATK